MILDRCLLSTDHESRDSQNTESSVYVMYIGILNLTGQYTLLILIYTGIYFYSATQEICILLNPSEDISVTLDWPDPGQNAILLWCAIFPQNVIISHILY